MTPFVLHAKPLPQNDDPIEKDDEYHMDANVVRYCDILSSIEELINVSVEYYGNKMMHKDYRLKKLYNTRRKL